MRLRAPLASLVVATALITSGTRAEPSAPPLTVVTRWSWVRGEPLEIVPGDHVTVLPARRPGAASPEPRVVPWGEIECLSRFGLLAGPPHRPESVSLPAGAAALDATTVLAPPSVHPASAAPPSTATIHFFAGESGALQRARTITATRVLGAAGGDREPAVVLECKRVVWATLCARDCAVEVPADAELRVALASAPPEQWTRFTPGPGHVRVRGGTPSRARELAGSVLIGVGTAATGGTIFFGGVSTVLGGGDRLGARRDTALYSVFWSGVALLGAGAALVESADASARITRAEGRPRSMHGDLRGVELGVRVIEGFRYQGASPSPTQDVKLDDGIRRHTAVEIEVGYRLAPWFSVALLGSHGPADVHCQVGQRCSGRVTRAGGALRGHWPIDSGRWSLWSGIGARYEWTQSHRSGREGETEVAYRGPQLFFAEAGVDVAPAPRVFLGPFVRAAFGHYDAVSARTPEEGDRSGPVRHVLPLAFFDLGLRAAFDL